jgi:hypothetical protein
MDAFGRQKSGGLDRWDGHIERKGCFGKSDFYDQSRGIHSEDIEITSFWAYYNKNSEFGVCNGFNRNMK